MPRTRSLAFAELKIGILAVVALAIAASVIFLVSGQGGFFWQRYSLKARFPEVPGLKAGAPVRVAGVEVGTVKDIEFVGSSVEVVFQVSESMRERITTESVASLGALSMLGQATVDVAPSQQGKPLAAWSYVKTGRQPGQLSDVAQSATAGLEQATALIQSIRAGQGTVGRLFTDDVLYREVTNVVTAASRVADDLKRGRGTAGRLVSDPAVYDSLKTSLDRLNGMLARVNAGEGSLGRLLQDGGLARSMEETGGHLASLTGRLERGEGTAGKLLTDEALYSRVSSVSTQLERVVTALQQGQGTAGQLLQDRRLYENMNGAVGELRTLIAEVRQNPRKYLSVKVSVF